MTICVSRTSSGAIGLHRPHCAPYPALGQDHLNPPSRRQNGEDIGINCTVTVIGELPVNVIQRRRGHKRRRVSKHAPSPLAGEDMKPWSRSGLGVVGEGDWSVGRASRCGIALRLRAFFYHAKSQSRKGAKKVLARAVIMQRYFGADAPVTGILKEID